MPNNESVISNVPEFDENLKKPFNLWKKSFFSILSRVYKQSSIDLVESNYKKSLFYFYHLLLTVQLGSNVWNLTSPITDWQNFNSVWYALEYTRLDVICAEISQSKNCIIGVYFFYGFLFFAGLFLYFFKVFFNKISKNLIFVMRSLLNFAGIFNIPLSTFLLLALKYSWTGSTPTEYPQTVSMNLSNLGITLSILCFFISAFANFCNEAFGFEIRHLVSVSNIAAKSYCKVELFSLFLNYLSIILYVFLFSKYFNIYHILMIFIHGIGGVMYFIYLPYYNLLGNFMKSLMHVFTFFSSIIILAGYREESAFFLCFRNTFAYSADVLDLVSNSAIPKSKN